MANPATAEQLKGYEGVVGEIVVAMEAIADPEEQVARINDTIEALTSLKERTIMQLVERQREAEQAEHVGSIALIHMEDGFTLSVPLGIE